MNLNLAKVICWRAISLIVGMCISYLYLGEIRSSIELTIIFTVVMTTLHFYFEKYWPLIINKHQKNMNS